MYRFGPFLFDPDHLRLRRGAHRLSLGSRAAALLEILLRERHRVVEKEELLRHLWPDTVGSESNLTVNLSALRRALGDDPRLERWIMTVPTRGYRFVGEVEEIRTGGAADAPLRPPADDFPGAGASPEAHEHYLRGRHLLQLHDPAALDRAVAAFERVLELEPSHAEALAGLGITHLHRVCFGLVEPAEGLRAAERAGEAALRLRRDVALAHLVQAGVALCRHWDGPSAEAAVARALDLAPGNALAHEHAAYVLAQRGRLDEARLALLRAQSLEPASVVLLTDLSWIERMRGDPGEALRWAALARERDDGFVPAHHHLACADFVRGRPGPAVERLERLRDATGRLPCLLEALQGHGHGLLGDTGGVRAALERLDVDPPAPAAAALCRALILAGAGRTGPCLDHLEEAARRRHSFVVFVRWDTLWDPVRQDERFAALVERIG